MVYFMERLSPPPGNDKYYTDSRSKNCNLHIEPQVAFKKFCK